MQKRLLFLLPFLALFALACQPNPENVRDFSAHYEAFQVEGSFVVLDLKSNAYTVHHPEQVDQPFLPASTFKICNSLVALETGVVPDLDFVLPWDSVERQIAAWNQDTDFRSAFRNSTVWYYQEVARRIGQERMDAWLTKLAYGNRDASGGIDLFWLTGGLRITPRQQVDFIAGLVRNDLPVAQRSMDLVKEIMVREQGEDYVLRGKTGWGFQGEMSVGWFVGYLERNGETHVFANCIQTKDENHPDFGRARVDIAYRILEEMDLLPAEK